MSDGDRDIKLDPSWKSRIGDWFGREDMQALSRFLRERKAAGARIFPPGPQIFSAFDATPFDQVKVVILGQDPYHGYGQAHGLCFSVQPGVPNAFGLIGAEANAVGPGKRPLSSMTPTIVLQRGKPIIAVGAAGGPKIISAVLQELVAMLDLELSPTEAVAAPRIHQQWSPDEVMAEKALPEALKIALEQRGHKVRELNTFSVSHLVARSPDGQSFIGAADPRAIGNAAGW